MSNSNVTKFAAAPAKKKPHKARPVHENAIAVRHAQMCEMLGIGPTKGYELIRDNVVESTVIGKTRLISVRSIRRLIEGEVA